MNPILSNSKTASESPSAASANQKKLQETLSRNLAQARQVQESLSILKDIKRLLSGLCNDVRRYSKNILAAIGAGLLIVLLLFAVTFWRFEYQRFPKLESQLGKIQASISSMEAQFAQSRRPQGLIFEGEDGRKYTLINSKVILTSENRRFVEITAAQSKENAQ